jgi:hypothetical protein
MPKTRLKGAAKRAKPLTDVQRAQQELWLRGNISPWKLRPVQKRMYEIFEKNPNLKTVFNSSRRIGKTFTLCLIAIETCLRTPGAQVRFACPTQKALKKIILPIFREILRDCPASIRPVWKAAEGMWVFKHNEAEIHVAGCTNGHEENLRGQSATLVLVDEAGFIKNLEYVVDDILLPQLLTSNGKLIMASTPPRTPAHDFSTYCQQAEIDGAYAKFTIYDSGYPIDLIEKFKKEAGGENSTTWKREYLAEFVVDEDYAIVPEWRLDFEHEPKKDQFYPLWHKYDGMDTGFRDFTAVLYGHYNFREARIYIEAESTIHGPTMTTKVIADTVKPKEHELWGDPSTLDLCCRPTLEKQNIERHPKVYRRIADNNDPIVLQDLSVTHNTNFQPTDKESLQAMVNKVREWVKAGRVRVSPQCKFLIGCLKYAVWDENRKEFERSKVYKHFDHLAALVYLIRNIDEATNPVPIGFGVDRTNTLISGDRRRLSGVGKALANQYGRKLS